MLNTTVAVYRIMSKQNKNLLAATFCFRVWNSIRWRHAIQRWYVFNVALQCQQWYLNWNGSGTLSSW